MQLNTVTYPYQFIGFSNAITFTNPNAAKEKSFEELQAKITELEKELLKEKEAAEKGAKILKLMWGDEFETDFLH